MSLPLAARNAHPCLYVDNQPLLPKYVHLQKIGKSSTEQDFVKQILRSLCVTCEQSVRSGFGSLGLTHTDEAPGERGVAGVG